MTWRYTNCELSHAARVVAADALPSSLPLNVDLDTTLTVVAGNLHHILARQLPRHETATPDRIWGGGHDPAP